MLSKAALVIAPYIQIDIEIKEYNELSRKLELIPSSANNANGTDYFIQINLQQPNNNFNDDYKAISSKLQTGKKEKLIMLKNDEVNLIRTLQENSFRLQEHLESINESVADTKRELEMLETKLNRLNKQYNEEKEVKESFREMNLVEESLPGYQHQIILYFILLCSEILRQ